MASETDADGYVHVPGDDADAAGDSPDGTDRAGGSSGTTDAEQTEEGFGTRGWVLVAAVVGSVLVVPGVIYALPELLATTGVPFVAAMLVLPLAPAALLGVVAVWSMSESSRR